MTAARPPGERTSTARRSAARSRASGLPAARCGGYDGPVTDGTVRVQGDGSLGIKVGLGMLLCLLPGLGLYSVFGERHFLGIFGACMGGLLALLAPIPLVVGARLSRHSIALAPDGTLRVTTDKRSAVFRLDALEALILAEGARGPTVLAFKTRDELLFVDPRGFEPAAFARVIAAIRAAKPTLPVIGSDVDKDG